MPCQSIHRALRARHPSPPCDPAITAFKFDQKPFATFVVQIFVVKVRDF
jgi:hypothetical protein